MVVCVYFMTGTPEGSTESGLMEKPGIEPVTPGLQDIVFFLTPRRLSLEYRCCITVYFQCVYKRASWKISCYIVLVCIC